MGFSKAEDCQPCLSCLKHSPQQTWDILKMDLAAFERLSLENDILHRDDTPLSICQKRDPQHTADYVHPERKVIVESEKEVVYPKVASRHQGAKAPKTTSRLNPTAPSYRRLPISPLGSSRPSQRSPVPGFVPYQPVRLRSNRPHRVPTTALVRSASAQEEATPPQSEPAVKFQPRAHKAPRYKSNRPVNVMELRITFSPDKLPMPVPTANYLFQASSVPRRISSPQSLLVVLDFNGTLLARKKPPQTFTGRPFLRKFLQYCLENHTVMIWSSARPATVDTICRDIFPPQQRSKLLREWARDTLDLTKQEYYDKVQVYKRLDRIWEDSTLQSEYSVFNNHEIGLWSQANTVLIDDSPLKARKQPYNHIEVPEYTLESGQEGGMEVLNQVVAYLEELRNWDDVSCFIKDKSFKVSSGWKWDREKDPNVALDERLKAMHIT